MPTVPCESEMASWPNPAIKASVWHKSRCLTLESVFTSSDAATSVYRASSHTLLSDAFDDANVASPTGFRNAEGVSAATSLYMLKSSAASESGYRTIQDDALETAGNVLLHAAVGVVGSASRMVLRVLPPLSFSCRFFKNDETRAAKLFYCSVDSVDDAAAAAAALLADCVGSQRRAHALRRSNLTALL